MKALPVQMLLLILCTDYSEYSHISTNLYVRYPRTFQMKLGNFAFVFLGKLFSEVNLHTPARLILLHSP